MKRDEGYNGGILWYYNLSKRKLEDSKILTEQQMNIIEEHCSNAEGDCLYCSNCGKIMTYARGRYICPMCSSWVRESTLNKMFMREAEKFEKSMKEDIPSGCRACGGPWPNCKDSCPLYDD